MSKELVKARALVVLIVLTIIGGSSIPSKNIPGIFAFTPDKLIHCAEYAVLGFFLFRWLRLEFTSFTVTRLNITTFLIGSVMGIIDENYQRLTPGRTTDFWDWVLDSIGVILIIVVLNYIVKNKPSGSHK